MNQHIHEYRSNIISPRKRNTETVKLCLDDLLNEQYLPGVEYCLKWNQKYLFLDAVQSVWGTRLCHGTRALPNVTFHSLMNPRVQLSGKGLSLS